MLLATKFQRLITGDLQGKVRAHCWLLIFTLWPALSFGQESPGWNQPSPASPSSPNFSDGSPTQTSSSLPKEFSSTETYAPTISPAQNSGSSFFAAQEFNQTPANSLDSREKETLDFLNRNLRVGYDQGFVISGREIKDLKDEDFPFRLKFNGWGHFRMTNFISDGPSRDFNQFQLKRARLIFSGHAFTPDFSYFIALDARSASNDNIRLLDYYLSYDLGHHDLGFQKRALVVKAGQYKIPFTLARFISGQRFQFTDRSMASMYFDANRSLAVGLYGERRPWGQLVTWETAVFNGLITGGAETGTAGQLDNNFAVSARLTGHPRGEWGVDDLCDWDFHEQLATRVGTAFATSTINREGETEFGEIRVVDSGLTLASILPAAIDQYLVSTYCVDWSAKYRGFSFTSEYYFRNINSFEGGNLPDLFDHGFWLQSGYFLIPRKLEALARWSRVVGNSGTLGGADQSSDERAGGLVWYFRRHSAKLTFDGTYIDSAPINSFALDMTPGATGWLWRTQLQFSF